MSCVSSAEAIVINAGGGLALAKGALDRIGDVLARRDPSERRQAVWDANAAFVQELGLAPAAVLGPRPVVRVPSVAAVGLGLRAVRA